MIFGINFSRENLPLSDEKRGKIKERKVDIKDSWK